jgi:tetratricopeptide (TPR) repeat protein
MFISKQHEQAYQILQSGDYPKAVELYSRCLLEAPDSAILLSERGVAFLHLNDKEKCMADLDKSVELDPKYSYRYASRGHAKDFFGDIDGAIDDYEIASELDPSDPIVYNNLGLLLEKMGRIKAAQDRFQRSDKLRRAEDELHSFIGDLEETEDVKPVVEMPRIKPIEKSKSTSAELGKIFTKKSHWLEFLKFIKNGFRLK